MGSGCRRRQIGCKVESGLPDRYSGLLAVVEMDAPAATAMIFDRPGTGTGSLRLLLVVPSPTSPLGFPPQAQTPTSSGTTIAVSSEAGDAKRPHG